mgnify:CR=1 FL=1
MATFHNLTPHVIRIKLADGEMLVIKKTSNLFAYCDTRYDTTEETDEGGHMIPIHTITKRGVQMRPSLNNHVWSLPVEREGHYYIVSVMVAHECPHRRDVLYPKKTIVDDTGMKYCLGFVSAYRLPEVV